MSSMGVTEARALGTLRRSADTSRRSAVSTAAPTRFDQMRAQALDDPEAFWGEVAEGVPWFRRWDRVYEADPPSFRWFVGGRTNLGWNAVDAHVQAGFGDRPALIAIDERGGERRLTYSELLVEVE